MPVVDADKPRLEARRPTGSRAIFPLGKCSLIGRDPDCDVHLADPEVSKVHCRIELDGETLWLHDLDSANGTFVNGRAARKVRLADGDELAVGNSYLVVRTGNLGSRPWPVELDVDGATTEAPGTAYPFVDVQRLLEESRQRLRDRLAVADAELEKLRLARDFHQGLSLKPEGDGVPELLVEVTQRLTGADDVVLYVVDERDQLMRRASTRQDDEEHEPALRAQVQQRVRSERAWVLSEDLRADARFAVADPAATVGVRSVLAVPLLVHGAVRGVLHCDSRRAGGFSEVDARTLAGLASHAALAMEKTRP